jgi:putative flippase GtrA
MWTFVKKLHLAVFFATLISAEICTVLRFFVNENWVFRTGQHCWVRLGQFHIANATAFIFWLAVTNLLVLKGVYYQLASVAGVGCSFGASFI